VLKNQRRFEHAGGNKVKIVKVTVRKKKRKEEKQNKLAKKRKWVNRDTEGQEEKKSQRKRTGEGKGSRRKGNRNALKRGHK